MKQYTEKEILDRVKQVNGYKCIPGDYWIAGIQSKEDRFNEFDDMFYLFKDNKLVMKLTGTTNAGLTGLKSYHTYNKEGCAVIKTDEWYYNLWKPGKHKSKMRALVQLNPIKYYRDWNKNNIPEEIGDIKTGVIGINFHTATYTKTNYIANFINGWSTGCQVANNTSDYYKLLDLTSTQKKISYCLIKEF